MTQLRYRLFIPSVLRNFTHPEKFSYRGGHLNGDSPPPSNNTAMETSLPA